MQPNLDTRLDQLAALGEPVRRALYRFVANETEPVSRDDAATALGLAHHVVKFHLDRLVDDGLLAVEYRRPAGRTGPGAGRPAKLYRAIHSELDASVPERRYDLAGRILVRAVARAQRNHTPVADALPLVAHDAGRAVGREIAELGDADRAGGDRAGAACSTESADETGLAASALAAHGFEPRIDGGRVMLSNCPFHALVDEEPELVCALNRAFVEGLLEGVGATHLGAELAPAPGRCCVSVHTRSA